MSFKTSIPLLTVILTASICAHASTFTLTTNGELDTFTLPSSPAVSSSTSFGFSLSAVPVEENGVWTVRQIDFFDGPIGGGLLIKSQNGPDFNGQGAALYTGSNAQPTFVTGTFNLLGTSSGVITITDNAAVPEPSPFPLLAVGSLAICLLFKRRSVLRDI